MMRTVSGGEVVYESPLPEGHDVASSKVKVRNVAKGSFGLARIYWPYLWLRPPIQTTRARIVQVVRPELLATALSSY
jgi:hypothetical protein